MIIELVGLPGGGKTTLAKALEQRGAYVVQAPTIISSLTSGILFFLYHPTKSVRILSAILRAPKGMRYSLLVNGFFVYAAKSAVANSVSRKGRIAVLDQGHFQLVISLANSSMDLVSAFPRPNVLVVVSVPLELRNERMIIRGRRPRNEFGVDVAELFDKKGGEALNASMPWLEGNVPLYEVDGTRSANELADSLLQNLQPTAEKKHSHQFFKTFGLCLAYALRTASSFFNKRSEVVVLMYHSIDHSGWKLSVTHEMFERQMKYLARKCWAVPLADVVTYVKGEKKLPAHAVAVTFDDGYRDLLTTILPVLERYRIPATVFIPSDMSVRTDPDGRPRLTEEELRTLAQSSLITIGSHAKSHRKFTELSLEEMRNESKESADKLAQITGKRPRLFAYPFGARSADAERTVKDVGYEAAFGITEGTIHLGDNLFRLKRVQVDGTMNSLLFCLRLTGAVDWNRRIVDTFRSFVKP